MSTSFGWEGKRQVWFIPLADKRGVCRWKWDPLRTCAIPERLRGVIMTRRYINPRLRYLCQVWRQQNASLSLPKTQTNLFVRCTRHAGDRHVVISYIRWQMSTCCSQITTEIYGSTCKSRDLCHSGWIRSKPAVVEILVNDEKNVDLKKDLLKKLSFESKSSWKCKGLLGFGY